MFHYCSGIFIISFLWEHIFPPSLFRWVSLPRFTFSLLPPLLRSSAGSALFSPQELYDSWTKCWDRKHLKRRWQKKTVNWQIGTQSPGGMRRRGMETGQEERVCIWVRPTYFSVMTLSFYLESFPNFPGSVYLASIGHMVLNVPALPSCAPLWRWWATSHMLNGSQQPLQHLFNVCLEGGYAFLGPISDRGGRNSSP